MFKFIDKQHWCVKQFISYGLIIGLLISSFLQVSHAFAQVSSFSQNLIPITSERLSNLKGLTIHPEKPLTFDFIIEVGSQPGTLKEDSKKLITYFLTALTIPEDQMWVNLSPYEKDRIIPEIFGKTVLGQDLLIQDYLLKKITASLASPDNQWGQAFWEKVHSQDHEKNNRQNALINTFNKIWIVPQKASVYIEGQNVFILDSHLDVMIEEDYYALSHHQKTISDSNHESANISTGMEAKLIRDIIIPIIKKEVNEGPTFANLRQIYQAVILASWYKQNLKATLLSQQYVNKDKIKGMDTVDKDDVDFIYNQYVQTLNQEVNHIIREEYDPVTQSVVQRQYFSGGAIVNPGKVDVFGKDKAKLSDYDLAKQFQNPVVRVHTQLSQQDPHVQSVKPLNLSQNNQKIQHKEKVSVIIATYNMDGSLEDAINSVLDQTYQNFEVLVMDDGSTDTTFEIMQRLVKKDSRIQYIRNKENRGKPAVLNQALDQFTGDYVVILDADDTLPEKSLEDRVNYLANNTDISFVYTASVMSQDNKAQYAKGIKIFKNSFSFASSYLTSLTPTTPLATLMYRKEIFSNEKKSHQIRFNEKLLRSEDIDLILKIAKSGYRVGALNTISYNYTLDSVSHNRLNRLNNRWKSGKAILKIVSTHFKNPVQRFTYYVRSMTRVALTMIWEVFFTTKNVGYQFHKSLNQLLDFTDRVIAGIMLVILFPFLVILGIAIAIDFPEFKNFGSVLYTEPRIVGFTLKGSPVIKKIIKFRTMNPVDKMRPTGYAVLEDPRITKLGHYLRRYRIDELPQLWNVVKGDLKFIGGFRPRALSVKLDSPEEVYKKWKKLLVKYQLKAGFIDPHFIYDHLFKISDDVQSLDRDIQRFDNKPRPYRLQIILDIAKFIINRTFDFGNNSTNKPNIEKEKSFVKPIINGKDKAILSKDKEAFSAQKNGGIDFNPQTINLSTQGDPAQIQIPSPANTQINIEALYPNILNIKPITHMHQLLGQNSKRISTGHKQMTRM